MLVEIFWSRTLRSMTDVVPTRGQVGAGSLPSHTSGLRLTNPKRGRGLGEVLGGVVVGQRTGPEESSVRRKGLRHTETTGADDELCVLFGVWVGCFATRREL